MSGRAGGVREAASEEGFGSARLWGFTRTGRWVGLSGIAHSGYQHARGGLRQSRGLWEDVCIVLWFSSSCLHLPGRRGIPRVRKRDRGRK